MIDFEYIEALYATPFFDLIELARNSYKKNFSSDQIELCTLHSFKTGGCSEDCAYCPQSAHYKTGLKRDKVSSINDVLLRAQIAKKNGSKRFCMGGAWRVPPKKEFPLLLEMIREVKALGLETCLTVGMLNFEQSQQLKDSGLDYYNHNIDTSQTYYKQIVTTRTYQDRLETIAIVAAAGIKVCCGGIIGMGESRQDRIEFLLELYNLPQPPDSIPINMLIPIKGTPLAESKPIDNFEFIRTVAIARILFPKSRVRLSAGRDLMSEEMQAWCFMAGVNSIFIGDTLLTASNPALAKDMALFRKLGITSDQNA